MAIAAVVALSGCARGGAVIDPTVEPMVQRVRAAPTPQRWAFTYQPDSASRNLACLDGVDVAFGVFDLVAGVLKVHPGRDAPSIIVIASSFMVANERRDDGPWDEVRFGPDDEPAHLLTLFDEVLAGYIATGTQAPDLNMIALAAIEIATAVTPGTAPAGVADTFRITVDSDRYLDELEANGVTVTSDARDRIPSFTVTVDDIGRVTALVVDASPTGAREEQAHRDRYIVTATYDVDAVNIPAASDRRPTDLVSLRYPAATESSAFGS